MQDACPLPRADPGPSAAAQARQAPALCAHAGMPKVALISSGPPFQLTKDELLKAPTSILTQLVSKRNGGLAVVDTRLWASQDREVRTAGPGAHTSACCWRAGPLLWRLRRLCSCLLQLPGLTVGAQASNRAGL